jgi:hypothetical protein
MPQTAVDGEWRRRLMLYLTRVRLTRIGHRKAWFGNLTLDFTDQAGWPVETVQWLRNRGGKTTMLSLLFAVLAPAKPDFLGYHRKIGAPKKTLTDYVPADATSHVVLEFTRRQAGLGAADPADRLLVGMACEWRGRRRNPGRDDNFEQLFYTLRPHEETLTLESLPFAVADVGRLPLARYAEQLRAAHKADPRLAAATFRSDDSKASWVDHLESLGVDPEAVRLQIGMNRRESSAEEGFVFDNHGAFLDFILDLAFDTDAAEAVSSLLVKHAADLRAEPQDRLELSFLTEAIGKLDTLAKAWEQVVGARTRFAALVEGAEMLAAELHAGAATAEQAALQAAEQRDQAAQELTRLTGQRRELAKKTGAARRLAAELTLAEAKRTLEAAAGRREQAEVGQQAWAAVPFLADQTRRAATLAALEEEVAAREQRAEPIHERCRAAAVALAGRLVTLRDADLVTAEASDTAAEASDEQADDAEADAKEAVGEAAKAHTELEAIDGTVRRVEEHISSAVGAGILPAGADATAVLARVTGDLERASIQASEVATELTELERARPDLAAAAAKAAERHREAAAHAAELVARAEQLAADAAAIIADPRVGEVAGDFLQADAGLQAGQVEIHHGPAGDPHADPAGDTSRGSLSGLDMWADGTVIADRLDELAAHADRVLVDLAVAAAEDERAQTALVDAQLLPCRPPVAAALAVLADKEFLAWSGWQYLAENVPAGRHADVIAAMPALIDGVVVLDSDDVDRAGQELAAAGLRPTAAVAISSADMLIDVDAAVTAAVADRRWLVVPPHRALYDTDVAEATLAEIDGRLARARDEAAMLAGDRNHDRKLADRIRGLLERCPPPDHARLLSDLAAARVELAAGSSEHRQADGALEAADRRATARRREHNHLRDRLSVLQRRADRLGALTAELAEVQQQRARIPQLRASKADAEQLRVWSERAAQELRAAARRQRAAAAAQRAAAQRRSEELDTLHLDNASLAALTTPTDAAALAGSSGSAASGQDDQEVPLEVLRERFLTLQQAWRHAVTDEGLTARLDQATQDLAAAQRAVGTIGERIRRRAQALLESSDGADEDRRAFATSRALEENNQAQAEFALAQQALTDAEEQAGALAGEAAADALDLDPDRRPATAAAANRYAVQLESERAAAQQAETAAGNNVDSAERQADAAAARHQLLDTYARGLSSKLDDASALLARPRPPAGTVPAAPFGEDPAAAKQAHDEAIGQLGEQMRQFRSLHGHAIDLAEELHGWAVGDKFEALKATRARLHGVKADELAEAAASLRDDYRPTANLLAFKLDQLGEHRRRIVEALAEVTNDALRLLDQVEKSSRLPKEGIGAWSRQPFVQVQFRRPASREQLSGQLSTLVDDLLHSQAARGGASGDRSSGSRPELPDGPALVKRSVRVAVGASFKAYVLEPDTFQVADRIPISKVSVLSGGQQLTIAIVLYCTLVEVRSAGRRRRAPRGGGAGGALLLDNPFGKVSDRSFFDLMHAVAGKLGIQLIYTGHDPNEASLETFRRVVRLRNDGVDPAGRRHVEVRDTWLRDGGSPDGSGISAAWVVITSTTATSGAPNSHADGAARASQPEGAPSGPAA